MNIPRTENRPSHLEQKDGWKKMTERYRSSLARFASDQLFTRPGEMSLYTMDNGFYLSGGSWDSTKAWGEGDEQCISEIEVLVENGKPVQLHGYAHRGIGQGTDIYLSKQALADFLEFSQL